MNEPRLPILLLQPSRRLAAVLIAAHVAVAGLLLLLPLPAWALAGTAVVLLTSAVHAVAHHALRRGRRAVTALDFGDREQVHIGLRDGSWRTGRILGTSTVGIALTILNIALDERRLPVHVIIVYDSLGADDFRRLRVWLRWGPRNTGDAAMWP
jgi:toxin CptA